MDPPWHKESGGGKSKRGADRHYPLVRTAELPNLIRQSGHWRPYRNAHVWICATNTCLADGLWLMGELGATYKTNVAWVKTDDPRKHIGTAINYLDSGRVEQARLQLDHARSRTALQIGLGQYLRGSHELLLFGVIGAGQAVETWKGDRSIPSVIRSRRTKHSRKPDEMYSLVERISQGPRVEFFATKKREGWDQWGNVDLGPIG